MKLLLATYEYPPDLGGVAAYLGGLFGAIPETRVARFHPSKMPLSWLLHLPKLWFAARSADAVVVSHVLPLGTAAMMIGKPYVVIVHGLDLRSAAMHPRKKKLAARVLKGAKFVVANSVATAAELAAFGLDHRTVAASYNSLGAFYVEQGDTATAVEYYGRALATWEKIREPDHADVGQVLSNLASAEESRGNLERARELGERGLRILETVHGADHPMVAHTTSNLDRFFANPRYRT